MSTMGITADAALRKNDDCVQTTALVRPKDEEEQLMENRLDTRLPSVRTEFKCDSSSRSANNNNTTTTSMTSNRVSSPILLLRSSAHAVRGADHGNPLRTVSRELCLTPQLNYIPPGLVCQLGDSGDYLAVCALGRFAAGHVWGPYLIHLSPECRQRLRGVTDELHQPSSNFSIAVKNDGTVADPNAIVLGEEHTWIKLLHESGLRATATASHDPNVDLLVDPTSKTITLVVTAEIKASDTLRGSLRIRSAHSISPTQLNDSMSGYQGTVGTSTTTTTNNNSIIINNNAGNSKSNLPRSPGPHTAGSTSPGSNGISVGSAGSGPKRDKKCTYCGIPFSNFDTLTAHMTHYCSRRPPISCPSHAPSVSAPAGSMGIAVSNASAGGLDPGGTAAGSLGKSGSAASGQRLNGSKRPASSSTSMPTVTDPALFSSLSNFAGQLPFFPAITFDKLGALSTHVPQNDSFAPHTDYADFSASLLSSVLPATFNAAVSATSGSNDPAATIRASLAATMLPYLARLLPSVAPGPVCSSTVPTATPTFSASATKPTDTALSSGSPVASKSLSVASAGVDTVMDNHARPAHTTIESSLPDVCDTPNLSDRIIPSPMYCNGCQRFFASGHLYSCHLQMSYRLLRTTTSDSDAQPATSSSLSTERDGPGSTFHLADAASRLGLVLAAPLVTTNGIHYVPVHPSCGLQFEQNRLNNHQHGYQQMQTHQNQQQQQHQSYRTSKRNSPGMPTKGARESSSISAEYEPVQSKSETNNPPTVSKPSGSRGSQAPPKILDLSCSPHGALTNASAVNLGRVVPVAEQTTAPLDAGSTHSTVPNGLLNTSSTNPVTQLQQQASSNDINPYSNLVVNLLTQLMTGAHDADSDTNAAVLNLPQLMAHLYSAASLYYPGSGSINNPTNQPSTPVSTPVPLIPLFAPFWLAPHPEAPSVIGLPSTMLARPNPNHTSPPPLPSSGSPTRDPKSGLAAIDLLNSVYPNALLYPAGTSLLCNRTDQAGLGKPVKPTPHAAVATAAGQSAPSTLQTSPTGSPDSPNCRPFLCTYCQTRFQAYTTYMAHQDIYCQARREALKNTRIPSGASSSTGNPSLGTASNLSSAVLPGSSTSPIGSVSNKRRRIQSPGPNTTTGEFAKSNQDQSQSASSSSVRLSPNATSSTSGGSGDDDRPDAVSPSTVKCEPVSGLQLNNSHLEPDPAAEVESSSSSGPHWEACGPSELRCSACGYVGQTARGMKMHRRLHDCDGTGSRDRNKAFRSQRSRELDVTEALVAHNMSTDPSNTTTTTVHTRLFPGSMNLSRIDTVSRLDNEVV